MTKPAALATSTGRWTWPVVTDDNVGHHPRGVGEWTPAGADDDTAHLGVATHLAGDAVGATDPVVVLGGVDGSGDAAAIVLNAAGAIVVATAPVLGAIHGSVVTLPAASLTIATNTQVNPTVVTTTENHGLANGDSVTISGSNSNPVIDGVRIVTVTGLKTFTVPVNVTTTPGTAGTVTVAPRPVPATPLADRTSLLVQARSANSVAVFVGDDTVTPATGIELLPGVALQRDYADTVELYACAAVAGQVVAILEETA